MLDRLRHAQSILPRPSAALESDEMDVKARGALAILIEKALTAKNADPIACEPDRCPNCGGPATSLKSPYCNDCCKGIAAFVRQLRTALRTGSIADPGRQSGLGQAMWRELGGGHPHRQSLIVDKASERIFKRDNYTCQVCGAPAVSLDHVGSG